MYTSYNGWSSRSKSTTDVYRASTRISELEDDSSYPPASHSTLSRLGGRRRCEIAASSVNISCDRSYLADDVRKQFEHGYETSTSNDVEDAPQSTPRSNNFVKRLVETLERRQREQQQQQQQLRHNVIGGSKLVNHEFYNIGGWRGKNVEVRTKLNATEKVQGKVFSGRLIQEKKERDEGQEKPKVPERKSAMVEERPRLPEKRHDERLVHELPTMPIRIPRVHAVHLEDLCEHEDEYVSSDDDYLYHGYNEKRETSATQENDSNTTSTASKPRKIRTARRTIKSVISTIKSWRLGGGPKSLPKGSRDYYATRESLGEEMRAFHRDTLPRLMKHAQIQSLGVAEQRDMKLQTPREFTKLIGSPSMMGEERQPSTATIHSLYGTQGRFSRCPDVARVQSELVMDEAAEVLHGSKKVVPPLIPPHPRAPEPEPLVRPSEVRDIEKRYSSDSGKVQLRRCHPPQLTASTTTLDVVYDVPRPITPITENVIIQQRPSSSHEYANVSGGDAGDDDEDKRMHCTAFTTF